MLVAVSKGHGAEKIQAAYDAGQRVFGENYAQELADKASLLERHGDVAWRFIGHLQRNKAKLVVPMVTSIDSVDSTRLARALDRQAAQIDRRLEVLVQVNVAREPQKSGCVPEDLESVVTVIQGCTHLDLRGLMTIAPLEEDPEAARAHFERLRELSAEFSLPELSMGMSDDMEIAIEEGSTIVRIGTAIFGPRGEA